MPGIMAFPTSALTKTHFCKRIPSVSLREIVALPFLETSTTVPWRSGIRSADSEFYYMYNYMPNILIIPVLKTCSSRTKMALFHEFGLNSIRQINIFLEVKRNEYHLCL